MMESAISPLPRPTQRIAVFTICSNNYLPFAHVLLDSVRRHHPEAALFLCLADRRAAPGLYNRDWGVVEAHTLGVSDFASFAFRYDIMEFNTALKPFMFLHLLDTLGFDAAVYLDPDIALFAPLTPVTTALRDGASFVLTPHMLAPNEDRTEPNDITIMRAGAYNLGFLAASRSALPLMGWWARQLRYHCVNAQAEGLFVDQKFTDLLPCFADDVAILHDPAVNVAYWNLGQRVLARDGEGWTVDGKALIFFHFSGFNPLQPTRLSKFDGRFVDDLPDALQSLLTRYAALLLAQDYEARRALPYAYGAFASGAAISADIRRAFRDEQRFWPDDPFVTFEAYLRRSWPAVRLGEVPQPEAGGEDAAPVRQRLLAQSQADDIARSRQALRASLDRLILLAERIDVHEARIASLEATVMQRDQALAEQHEVLMRTQGDWAQTRAELAQTHAVLAQRDAELFQTQGALAVSRAETALHRGEVATLRQSTSWRVTRPLRALANPRAALRVLLRR